MNPTRNSLKLKQTPTTEPELLQHWQHLYSELITTHPKSRALELIGKRYGVSRQTMMYHLFPDYRENQKKQPSKKWSHEKQDPVIRRRVTDYKAKYMAARRHIGQLVTESYRRTAPQEALSLTNLRDAIYEISGIAFRPSTLDGLIKRLESTWRSALLVEVASYKVSHYRISDKFER